ncbi:uncharacterized protein LOC143880129 [Tasmannia lanceolata]|uniref:uncharacterized protein LOC143880129 n=1 Tax=Tasmannia lanceolata TaxID=3420 RepID=UPI0040632BC4
MTRGKGKRSTSGAMPKTTAVGNNTDVEPVASQPVKADGEAPTIVSGGEENPEEKGGVQNEEKVMNTPKKLNKRKRKKKNASLGGEDAGGEENPEEKEGVQNEEKVMNTPTKLDKRRRKKKNASLRGDDAIVAKDAEKPKSSAEKKESKKAESMGLIFMCNALTKKDCYRYKVLGLPANKKEMVAKVYKGMRLFLFDVDLRLMYGIYKAAGPGGYNIEPKAFKTGFPSQVRFTAVHDCLPLPEEKFKAAIKDNYYGKNKFDCLLNSQQVKNLCKLFQARSNPERGGMVGRMEGPSTSWGGERMYSRYPDTYQREAYVSPRPIASPLPPPAYAYANRPMEMDYYRTELELRDRRFMDLEPPRPRDEIERRDPYGFYHAPAAFRDPPYPAGLPPRYIPPPLYRY